MEVKNDKVVEKNYLDFFNFSRKIGEENENWLFQWVKPLYLDGDIRNPNPRIVAHAREFGVDVEWVLFEEVHSESFSKDIDNSF